MGEQIAVGPATSGVPVSFSGSATRIWGMTRATDQTWARVLLGALAAVAIAVAWCAVAILYVVWAIVMVPFQRLRARRRAVEDLGTQSVKHANIVR